jgi:hypothetical protein
MSIKKILNYYHLLVFSFTRHILYDELADSWKRKVIMKNFAYRVIENGKVLKDETRIHIGRKLVSAIEENEDVGLWGSLKNLVSKSDWPLLKAAEISNNIPDAISHISKVVCFKINIVKQIITSTSVMLVVAVLCAATIAVTADTIDKILDTAPNIKFSGFNAIVVSLSGFFTSYWTGILLAVAASICVIVYYAPRLIGPCARSLMSFQFFRSIVMLSRQTPWPCSRCIFLPV